MPSDPGNGKRPVRWDLIAASALLGASLIISAYLIASPRYAGFALYGGVFIRVDQRSGEVMKCTYDDGCQHLWIQPAADEVDNLMANAGNESQK